MNKNHFRWISLICFIYGILGVIELFKLDYTWSPEMLGTILIILFGFGYGYHLRTKKQWGFS